MFWLATIELYLFIQNMLTPMGDHIIWKLRFESSGRNAGFSWKSRTRYLKRSSEKRCLSGLRHCSFRSSNRRNAVRASPKTAPDLPRIASLFIRGWVLFILQKVPCLYLNSYHIKPPAYNNFIISNLLKYLHILL